MKGWLKYALTFLAGAVLCGAVVLWVSRGAGAKLNADLSAARTSLADAIASNTKLAESNRNLAGELNGADQLVASEQRTIAQDKLRLASLQSDLDAAKRGLEELVGSVASGLGDLDSSAKAIADLTGRLYSFYHPGAGGSKSP